MTGHCFIAKLASTTGQVIAATYMGGACGADIRRTDLIRSAGVRENRNSLLSINFYR